MTNVTAKLSGYRQAPRKVRLISGLIKGKTIARALVELDHRAKKAAPVFAKLLKSAVANATVQGLDIATLVVKEVRVDKGPVLKRSRPRAQGRAFPIHKHTSHIMVTLEGSEKIKDVKTAEKGKTEKTTTTKKTKAVSDTDTVTKKKNAPKAK